AIERTDYAPVSGIVELRQAIAGYIERTRGISCSASQVVIGPGSKPLIYALLQILEGDLLLPVPSWVSYGPQAMLAGRRVIPVSTDPENHHRLLEEDLTEAITGARQTG